MNIIEKYLIKKKEYVVSYCKILGDFIILEPLTLYKGKVEFNKMLNIIVEKYIKKYYFETDDSYILIGDYFDFNIKENQDLNRLIFLIDDYYKNTLKIDTNNYKKDIYYVSSLICWGLHINNEFNSILENRKYKTTLDRFLINIKAQKEFKLKKNKNLKIKELNTQIKENIDDEKKFFEYFEMPEIYNKFKKINSLENTYFVRYEYNIEDKRFKKEYINKVFKQEKINQLFLMISYELLSVTLMKSSNLKQKNIKYVIPIIKQLFNNEQDIKKINKIFDRKEVKEKIIFLIDEKALINEPIALQKLKNNNYNLCVIARINEKEINGVKVINENSDIYLSETANYISENDMLFTIREENK